MLIKFSNYLFLPLKTSFLPTVLLCLFSFNINAQTVYEVITNHCTWFGANYMVIHPDDWFYYDCNPHYIVKWKVYSQNDAGECTLESLTYGTESPPCLCDGVVRLELMHSNSGCLTTCEDIQLPPCKKKGGDIFFSSAPDRSDYSSEILTTGDLICEEPCGSKYGEACPTVEVELTNISYCIEEGISGTIVDVATGEILDCHESISVEWRHFVPNPNPPFTPIANATGFGSDVGNCLCGGTLEMRVKNACCDLGKFYYLTPDCADDDGSDRYSGSNLPSDFIGLSANDVLIYPNPASDNIQLIIDRKYISEDNAHQIHIYNQQGALVKQPELFTNRVHSMDVSDLLPGVYWINIIGVENISKKIIIQ